MRIGIDELLGAADRCVARRRSGSQEVAPWLGRAPALRCRRRLPAMSAAPTLRRRWTMLRTILGPAAFIQAQRQVLEDLFGRQWFDDAATKQHPAFERWTLCNDFQSGRLPLRNPEVLGRIAQIMHDNFTLVQATHGHQFRIGDLANYGDDRVQRRIRAVVEEPRQFLDLLLEISWAAWHIGRGHAVTASEDEGMPDFQIVVPSASLPIAADCKRVQAQSSDQRFRKLVNKANRQIKNLGIECHGMVVIDITERVPPITNLGDDSPAAADHVCDIVQGCLQRAHTSVSGAIVTWRDVLTTPMRDGSGGTLCVLRQHSRLVRHQQPLHPLSENDDEICIGYTSGFQVRP